MTERQLLPDGFFNELREDALQQFEAILVNEKAEAGVVDEVVDSLLRFLLAVINARGAQGMGITVEPLVTRVIQLLRIGVGRQQLFGTNETKIKQVIRLVDPARDSQLSRHRIKVILAGNMFSQDVAEVRIRRATSNLQLERYDGQMTEEIVRKQVSQLQQYFNTLQNDQVQVCYQNRFHVEKNALCSLTLYNFYILQLSLFTSVRRLRGKEEDQSYSCFMRMYQDPFFQGLNPVRLSFWSSCARTVVDLLILRGLLVAVVPERFKLYKILGRRSVEQVKQEVLEDDQFELLAAQIMNSREFKGLHNTIAKNARQTANLFNRNELKTPSIRT